MFPNFTAISNLPYLTKQPTTRKKKPPKKKPRDSKIRQKLHLHGSGTPCNKVWLYWKLMLSSNEASAPKPRLTWRSLSDEGFVVGIAAVVFAVAIIWIYHISILNLPHQRSLLISSIKVKLAVLVEGDPKAPFSIATTWVVREGVTPFPGMLHFTLDPYLIMLSVKQGSIKYHFLNLWYNSTWD